MKVLWKTTLNHKHWVKWWNSGSISTDVWWIRTTQGGQWTRSNAKLCYFVIPCKILLTYWFSDKRAGGCSQKPDTQATNHDVFAIVAVAKVTEERGQKEKTADENWKWIDGINYSFSMASLIYSKHTTISERSRIHTQRCFISCLIVCTADYTWVCHALTLKTKQVWSPSMLLCVCQTVASSYLSAEVQPCCRLYQRMF